MSKTPRAAAKPERLSEHPLALRVPAELVARLDALVEHVAADSDTATLLGGVTRSSVTRLALVEGVRALESRYHQPRRRAQSAPRRSHVR